MFSTADTIVAIATPPGRGGIGVVRLSGSSAPSIAGQLVGRRAAFRPRYATFARLASRGDEAVGDEVVVTVFPAPASYTGENVVEISAHGSPVVLAAILRAAVTAGARLAEPGEFTLRAFLHGKRDLVQAEAVADLIDAVTPLQARAAFDQLEGTLTGAIAGIEARLFDLMARLEASLDFPDEGYHFIGPEDLTASLDGIVESIKGLLAGADRGRLIREGALVSVVGAPNVGKSSLFNALLNANRAIVTPMAGTTRDLLTERVEILGLSLALVDTAGLRETVDEIEREGVARAQGVLRIADLSIVVLDRSRLLGRDDWEVLTSTSDRPRVVVVNKIDLPEAWRPDDEALTVEDPVFVSARSGEGLARLAERVAATLSDAPAHRDVPLVTNLRHTRLLEESQAALARARQAIEVSGGGVPEECLLADLQEAVGRLQEVTGQRSTEDLLRHIFDRFCIGK